MVAISLDAAGLFRRQKGALGTVRENDRDQGQTRRKPDLAMSRTDATMVLRFALIVSHAWVTLTARVQYPNIRLNLNGLAVADLAMRKEGRTPLVPVFPERCERAPDFHFRFGIAPPRSRGDVDR